MTQHHRRNYSVRILAALCAMGVVAGLLVYANYYTARHKDFQ